MSTTQDLAAAAGAGDAQTVLETLRVEPGLARAFTDDGWSMLHLASTAEVATLLLDAGADIGARNRHKQFGPGNSPLHAALYQRYDDVIELLLSSGADVNASDDAGWTPLHMAVANSQIDFARKLLDVGADPNARIGVAPRQEWSGKRALGLLSVANRTGEGARPPDPAADAAMRELLLRYGARE